MITRLVGLTSKRGLTNKPITAREKLAAKKAAAAAKINAEKLAIEKAEAEKLAAIEAEKQKEFEQQQMVTKLNFDIEESKKKMAMFNLDDLNQSKLKFFENLEAKSNQKITVIKIKEYNAILEKASFTNPSCKGIEITLNIDQFSEKEKTFILENFYQHLVFEDLDGQNESTGELEKLLMTFSEESNYELKNRKLAIQKMENLLDKILSLDVKKVKKFVPYISQDQGQRSSSSDNHPDRFNELPKEWQSSMYVRYGPWHDKMEEPFGWEIMPGRAKVNNVLRDWHDNREKSVIDREIREFLKTKNHSKRFIKKSDKIEPARLYPVYLQE